MGNKEDKEFCRKIQIFSRKELQGLFRIYGLPSDTSIDDLVKLMLSSLERKSMSSVSSGEKSSGAKELPLPVSSTPELQYGAQLKSQEEAGKVSCGIIASHTRGQGNNEKCYQTGSKQLGISLVDETCNKLPDGVNKLHIDHPAGSCMASGKDISDDFDSSRDAFEETSHLQNATAHDESCFDFNKGSPKKMSGKNCSDHATEGGAGDFPLIQHKDVNIGTFSGQSACASSTKAPSSLFEYHVESDMGINLYVDLNSGSSYWTNRLKNEVYVCPHVSNQRFQGLHHDLGQRLAASARQDTNLSLWNKPSGHGANDGYLETASFPSSNLRDNDVLEDAPNVADGPFGSGAVQACSVAVETTGSLQEDKKILLSSQPSSDAQTHMVSGTKNCSEDGETTTLNANICSIPKVKSTGDSSANSTSDGPKSFGAWEHQNSKLSSEFCENSAQQNAFNFLNPSVASGSVEMRLSEDVNCCTIASFSPGNSGVLHLAPGTEEQEGGTNLAKGIKITEKLQLENAIDKTCLKSDPSDSIEGLPKKRKYNDGEFRGSTEHLSREFLPGWSTQLVSKDLFPLSPSICRFYVPTFEFLLTESPTDVVGSFSCHICLIDKV